MSHELLVYLAKTFGLIWMMGFFLIVVVRTYAPSRRAAMDRAARSILPDNPETEDRHGPDA
ncbi:MAG: cbb3-type cytochrome c oxidase subunit 3 [Proteobacteria bacterium]|nr:cbb3-type cytochrome c oxidase subunit 3 [Pseudomonadota bacterium]MBS0571664.1 cbb3-type cytochrome c oxidase subunit 3 [Pseudomonadota bacterium]